MVRNYKSFLNTCFKQGVSEYFIKTNSKILSQDVSNLSTGRYTIIRAGPGVWNPRTKTYMEALIDMWLLVSRDLPCPLAVSIYETPRSRRDRSSNEWRDVIEAA